MRRKFAPTKASYLSIESIFPEGTDGEPLSSTTTYLPLHPCFTSYRVSNTFRNLHETTDPEMVKGALKGIILDYSTQAGLPAGNIGERTSLMILAQSKVTTWLKDLGLSQVVFNGLHNSTFYVVSSGRMRMSVDLYIDRFLPTLAKTLRDETNNMQIRAIILTEAILLPLFQIRRSRRCLPGGKLLVDFASINRGFFTKGAVHETDSVKQTSGVQPYRSSETIL